MPPDDMRESRQKKNPQTHQKIPLLDINDKVFLND